MKFRTLPILLAAICLRASHGKSTAAVECPMNASEPAPEGARLREDGVLLAGRPERSYPPSAYRSVRSGYALCTCALKPCVRKCCKPDMAFDAINKCTKFDETLDDFKVPKCVNALGTVEEYDTNDFHLVYGKLRCNKLDDKYTMKLSKEYNYVFHLSKTGWLLNELESKIAPPGLFCLEKFSKFDFKIIPVVCYVSPTDLNQTENDIERTDKHIFIAVGMILSLPFLFSTLLVYAFIRELRNLHGTSLMCHVATLLVAYIGLIIIKLNSNNVSVEVCKILAYITQFSFLASFFWLNVMCIDLWRTFSGSRTLKRNSKGHDENKFILYSLYAWGSTSLISILTFYVEVAPSKSFTDIRPHFGKNTCWFYSNSAMLLYFYGPISILLFSNLLMFIHTATIIFKKMKDVQRLCGSESYTNVNHDKQRFMLHLKLFIVMGVNWLTEVISWAISSDRSEFVWYFTDIGNSLQGVLIFFIFVCKKRVLQLLNKKLCSRFQLLKISNTVSTKTTNGRS